MICGDAYVFIDALLIGVVGDLGGDDLPETWYFTAFIDAISRTTIHVLIHVLRILDKKDAAAATRLIAPQSDLEGGACLESSECR